MGIGLIGCGDYARFNLEALARAEELHLAGAFDLDPAKAQETCREFGGVPFEIREKLLASPAVDAVIVATPNSRHCADTVAALDAGKHVFVNIPVTLSTDEAQRMIEHARSCGRVLMAGANHRKNPAVIALQGVIASGKLGESHLMQASVSSPNAYSLVADSWRSVAKEAPLLPFSQMGIIALELALMMWGPPETVFASIGKRDGPTRTPDLGAVIAKYANGRIFSMVCSYVTHGSYWLTASGRKGTATWDLMDANSLCIVTDTSEPLRRSFVSNDEQLDELHEFRDCIRTHKEPEAGKESIYNLAEFCRAIASSIASDSVAKFVPWEACSNGPIHRQGAKRMKNDS